MELKLDNLSEKQSERLVAFQMLEKNQYFNSALQIFWSIIREEIFNEVAKNGVKYKSSDEAIYRFIELAKETEISKVIQELYILSTITEYDLNFFLSEVDYKKIRRTINSLIPDLKNE